MKIYIHFGIYKTGSSYLQSLCLHNKTVLAAAGYCYPASIHDQAAFDGDISPGNASRLARTLENADHSATEKIFKNWIQEAKAINCNKILVSNEALIHVFAEQSGLKTLMGAANSVGITDIFALGFLRDPVEHVLSTFKHRGKTGKIKDFRDWIRNTYETPAVLEKFVSVSGSVSINWKLRRFKKDPSFLRKAFFEDWLNIDHLGNTDLKAVNESVTLSEVILMQHLYTAFPVGSSFFMEALFALPRHKKAHNRKLEQHYREIAIRESIRYEIIYESVNQLLPAGEELRQVDPEKLSEHTLDEKELAVKFSQEQIEIITRQFRRLNSLPGIMRTMVRWIGFNSPPVIGKIYRSLKH